MSCALAAIVVAVPPPARAESPPAPVIDGDLADLVAFAQARGLDLPGCGAVEPDQVGDVATFDPELIPCVPVVDHVFANGFDLARVILAHDDSANVLYLGIETAGAIGDVDGDGDPDAPCAASNMDDPPGIGPVDEYRFDVDVDCQGVPRYRIRVSDNRLTVNGAVWPGAVFAWSGRGLELAVPGIDASPGANVRAFAGCGGDGLSEDTAQLECRPVGIEISLRAQADVFDLCPDSSVTYTIEVGNPSPRLSLEHVYAHSLIPDGLQVIEAVDEGTPPGQPSWDGNVIQWPAFSLAAGETRILHFRALRTVDPCFTPFLHEVEATGQFVDPCVAGGDTLVVKASRVDTVRCRDRGCDEAQATGGGLIGGGCVQPQAQGPGGPAETFRGELPPAVGFGGGPRGRWRHVARDSSGDVFRLDGDRVWVTRLQLIDPVAFAGEPGGRRVDFRGTGTWRGAGGEGGGEATFHGWVLDRGGRQRYGLLVRDGRSGRVVWWLDEREVGCGALHLFPWPGRGGGKPGSGP